jgi:transposase
MSKDAAFRPNDLDLCYHIINEQQSTIGELQQVSHYVERLLLSKPGPRSERVDPNLLPLLWPDEPIESAINDQDETETEAPVIVQQHFRRGSGRGPLPDHLLRKTVEHDTAESEKPCPCCGDAGQRIGCETSEQLKFVPAVLMVIEHVRWKYACSRCEEQVAMAPVPDMPQLQTTDVTHSTSGHAAIGP